MKSLFITFLSFFTAYSCFATIHYFEVYQQVNSSTPFYIDIDLDGDNDFYFTVVDVGPNTGSFNFYVNCSKSTSFYAADGTSDTLPKAYNQGAALGTHNWRSATGLLSSPTMGFFRNTTKYLMVQFSDNNNNTYNGWVLIGGGGFTGYVEAYAYSDVPNQIILAGEIEPDPTSVNTINQNAFDILSINTRQVAFKNIADYDKVEIYALDGKLISRILNPAAAQHYNMEAQPGILLLSFFKGDMILHSRRYFVSGN